MKVVVLNGSPNGDKGNTAIILSPFIEGMKQAGAEVQIFYPHKMNIKPCLGEFSCWLKTPGTCFQKDDIQQLLPILQQADILVIATPVYVDSMTGPLKNMIDRLIPLAHPTIELRDNHSRHPLREASKKGQLVLVSNCGFWEIDNFDPLINQMIAMSKNINRKFAGALLRPHGPALKSMLEQGMPVDDILEAAKEAGRQLITNSKIDNDILQAISRELLPRDMYNTLANQQFNAVLSNLE